MELTLAVIVDKAVPVIATDTISFETGASPAQVREVALHAYEHHGEGFTADTPGALQRFYEDLLLGRPMPLRFATRGIADFDVLFAVALFLHRDLIIQPNTPATIAMVDAAHRIGLPYIAHLDPGFGRFLRRLRVYFPSDLGKREIGERMTQAVEWVREYILDGRLPHLGNDSHSLRVIDQGTRGFVFAQAEGPLLDAWLDAFRRGFLRGFIVGPDREGGRRNVLAARKSPYVSLNLHQASEWLNEMERAMGEPGLWKAEPLWLHGPMDGTVILPSHLMEVFLRVLVNRCNSQEPRGHPKYTA